MTAIPFAITPLSVIQDTRLHASDYRVLLGLLTYADRDTLECFPKRSTLAERIGLSVTRVQQVLTRLSSLGWIERTRTGRATTYRITPPTAPQEATGGHRRPVEATEAPTPPFPSDSNPALSIASIEGTDHLSDQLPPSPLALATTPDSATSATRIDQEQRQREQQERQAQRDQERQARQERHLARQEARQQRKTERQATAGTRSEAAQKAVQRVLGVFRDVCNVSYPNSGAIAQRVASAIEQHGESTLIRVIRHRGSSFRYPLALLKPELIESINAELERPAPQQEGHQERQRERRWFGIPESIIVKHARPGEDHETVAYRLLDEQRMKNSKS